MPKISLCMIVRDEADHLADCLKSVADLVQEIIIVDTGSKDATREIARAHGAQVFDFAWIDDFSAARNKSLRHATGDWIFWLDADDRLDETNRARFRQLAATLTMQNLIYMMHHASPTPTGDVSVLQERFFRNGPKAAWRNRVHESVAPALQEAGYEGRTTDVVISHVGYADPAAYRRKQERNLRLLEMAIAESPRDAVALYNLGRTQIGMKLLLEGFATLDRAARVGPLPPQYLRDSFRLKARALIQLNRHQEARATCLNGRVSFPDDADLCFLEGEILDVLGDLPGAENNFKQLLDPNRKWIALTGGVNGYLAHQNLGAIYRRTNRDGEAETSWGAAVTERPDFRPAWISLGELYTAHKHWAPAAEAFRKCIQQGRGRDDLRRRAWRGLIRAQFESGQPNQALATCRDGRTQVPDDADLCFLESQLLLTAGDLAGAQRTLEELLQEGRPWSGTDPALVGFKSRQNLGVVLLRQDRAAEAEVQFRRVVQEQPTFFVGWAALADLYVTQKRWTDAEQVAKSLDTFPEGKRFAPMLRDRIAKASAAPNP